MNKNTLKTLIFSMITTIIFLGTAASNAAWYDNIPLIGGKKTPGTLIITGNYAKPRLLAEVAQLRDNATIMLITETPEEGEQVYFMEQYPDAELIPQEKIIEFLAVLSPERIIILGNENYVPSRYEKMIRGRYPLSKISGEDWMKNAKALASTVNDRKLPEEYRYYLASLLDEQIKRSDFSEDIPMRDRILVP